MYFGKPIPEWITEHRDDTVTLGDIVDYCEKAERVLDNLSKRVLDGKFNNAGDIAAYAYFNREREVVKRPVDVVMIILGERYGYPDDPEEDE